MKPGTKPKPTALKKLEGDIHKERWNKNEPQPAPIMPKSPWWLDYWARKEWNRICPELYKLGLLTSIDVAALEGYCSAYSRWVKAEKELNKGFTYEYRELKSLQLKRTNKPEVAIARDALNQVKAFLVEFGMTPASRTRIVATPANDRDEFDELLNFCNSNNGTQDKT